MPSVLQRMATPQFRRATRSRALVLGALAMTAALGACDLLIPQGGYDKVVDREKTYGVAASNPAPPPYVPGFGSGGAAVPQLAANAPAGVTQAMVEEGAQLYGTVCAACHGAAGAGTAAAPALNDAEWLNISGGFEDIVNIIHTGVANPVQYPGAMPALGGGQFNEEQVRQLAAYVLALSQAT